MAAQKPVTDSLSFLKPFAWQLWVAIAGALLGVAAVSQLLARLFPLGRYEVQTTPSTCRTHCAYTNDIAGALLGVAVGSQLLARLRSLGRYEVDGDGSIFIEMRQRKGLRAHHDVMRV